MEIGILRFRKLILDLFIVFHWRKISGGLVRSEVVLEVGGCILSTRYRESIWRDTKMLET
ncbi:hypothetical protein J7L36_00750 [bacterium]|nr:hypothetical protein [bacterium]